MQEFCKNWIPIKIMKVFEQNTIEEYIEIMMYIFKKYIKVVLNGDLYFFWQNENKTLYKIDAFENGQKDCITFIQYYNTCVFANMIH